MIIQTAVICDAATDYEGKLNLLGAFDTIGVSRLPTRHPQFFIALRIAFERPEDGSQVLRLNFVDEDRKLVLRSADMPVTIRIPAESNFITRNFIVNVQDLEFTRAGSYAVEIGLNNQRLIRIPLAVRLVVPPGQSAVPSAAPPSAPPGPYIPPTSHS